MKYFFQFGIILGITFVGELLHLLLPLPVPASIYGFVILLLLLVSGILKLDKVKETGDLLIAIMSVMFIPAMVGVIDSWAILKTIIVPIVVIAVVTTILVMGVSGRVTQFIKRFSEASEVTKERKFSGRMVGED